LTKIQQFNYRLDEIAREIELIQRAADGWEYTGQNNRSQIADQVHNIRVDLAQLRLMADEAICEGCQAESLLRQMIFQLNPSLVNIPPATRSYLNR